MIVLLVFLINALFVSAITHDDIITTHELTVTSTCGNIEFDINFMQTEIYISNPYKIQNLTVQDSMEDANNLILVIGDQGGTEDLKIKVPMCAKSLMVEVCSMEDQDAFDVKVVQHPKVCYMTHDSSVITPAVEE